ncbi:MAG TPA: GTPase HflX [Caldilinea sp.]|nr:GTPase HflX [Caldilinea sp.]
MTNPNSFKSEVSSADQQAEGRSRQTVARDEAGLVSTAPVEERAVLVGVELQNEPSLLTLEDSLDELALLAKTAGVKSVARLTQRLDTPNPATLIGSGKLEELQMVVTELGANVVIFDDELSPRQQRELEKTLGEEVKVIDRTALILDIFARHARTREGAVQVELAQYEYRLPRLTRAWTHLARQAGGRAGGASGGVGVRGPGETQLEVDRREINRRIAFLKRQIADITKYREQYRAQRRQASIPVVAVVGYTNAGKSTLLNTIADADVVAEDQLFATLDPTTRRVKLPSDRLALFSDTVGFIQKLPTMLVAAFRSTLEEVTEADLLVHVVDISHANMEEQIAAVEEVLDDLGAADKPIVVALNKIDRLDRSDPDDAQMLAQAVADNPAAVLISARKGWGLDDLLSAVDNALKQRMAMVDVLIPYSRGDLVAMMHEHGTVESEEHTETGTHLIGHLPMNLAGRLAPYWTANAAE